MIKVETKKRRQRFIRRLLAVLVILALALGLGYAAYQNQQQENAEKIAQQRAQKKQEIKKLYRESKMSAAKKKYLKPFLYTQDPDKVISIIKHYKDYPTDIIKYASKDTDRFEYLYQYPKRKGKSYTKPLKKSEVNSDHVVSLIQWDTRWGYQTYGEAAMARTGCAPTSLSMVLSYLKQDRSLTPAELDRFSEANNEYVDGAGTSWDLFPKAAEYYGVNCTSVSLDADSIRSELEAGHPIIMSVKAGIFTSVGHFIVLSGINKDGTVKICDPNSKKNTKKSWKMDTLLSQGVMAYSFSNQ
ncbi:C39 family peptidase [Catenisphaera adipataccumulans]|jgi:hypothetical protein|uniref:Peptidase C39-like domain-containing protein n=1 Tax=Catenisphaera adipataccumulans TaxID=700500 RepID=A0A7W8FV95_9FIRM|nr:C39 family peptidase [Catenisphaera adipataccumulans]MBB5183399.1 hypothetical protein [Catenisphaera adipataccumulans]